MKFGDLTEGDLLELTHINQTSPDGFPEVWEVRRIMPNGDGTVVTVTFAREGAEAGERYDSQPVPADMVIDELLMQADPLESEVSKRIKKALPEGWPLAKRPGAV